jgi:CRP-like cAMP-binding protein
MFLETPNYPVSAVALEPSKVAAVPNADFILLLERNTETSRCLLADLSRKLHGLVREIGVLTLENATNRIIYHLIDLAGLAVGSATVTLEESRQTLASRLSIAPETFSRSLRTLSDAGVIQVEGRTIHVPDLEKLRRGWQ